MKTQLIAACAAWLLVQSGALAQVPNLPPPEKEHQWIQQFVGEWESEIEIMMSLGQPPMKGKGTETCRMIGGFWVIGEGKSDMMGMPFSSVLTLGYDPGKKKFIGTWIDSMASHLWHYVGSLDSTGKILTLETEGPSPMAPGKMCKFKESTEFKSKDHRVFTSQMLGEDGKWTTFVTVTSKRKK